MIMFRIVHRLVLFIICFILFLTHSPAQEAQRESLKKVKTLNILIEELDPEIESNGLSEDFLKTKIELALRQSGIKISEDTYELPSLYLNVNTLRLENRNAFVYNLSLEFHQPVRIIRTNEYAKGTTWNRGSTGIVSSTEANEIIVKSTLKLMDYFINDFLAANPKTK